MTETAMNDWNQRVIQEFRANGGKVGGQFEGANIVLLTTKGAKSGKLRTSPLVCFPDGDRFMIVASKAGAPTNPDWYYNLLAYPDVTIEVGTDKFEVTASVLPSEERAVWLARIVEIAPGFGEYQKNTTREIPIVALTKR